jgi:hypothetical protein
MMRVTKEQLEKQLDAICYGLIELDMPIDLSVQSGNGFTQIYANNGSKIMSLGGTKMEIYIALNAIRNVVDLIGYQKRQAERNS